MRLVLSSLATVSQPTASANWDTVEDMKLGDGVGQFQLVDHDGNRFVERILSTVATLSAQKRNVLDFLMSAHVNHVAGLPAPSLLPPQADPA